MVKKIFSLIFLFSVNSILSMEEKMDIDLGLTSSSGFINAGKRKRDEVYQVERNQEKKSIESEDIAVNMECASSKTEKFINFLHVLPVELQLMILSYVIKNNNSICECFRNLYLFSQVSKDSLSLIEDKNSLNALLKCITYEINEDTILDILRCSKKCDEKYSAKMKLIKDKLKIFIYDDLFLNTEYMIKLFKKLIAKNLYGGY